MAEFLKALKVAAAAAVLATGFATFAKADAPSPIVYFGVHGGKSIANTELSIDGAPISLDGIGSHGFVGGVHLGVDLPFGGGTGLSPFVGVFGGYSWQNVETTLSLGGTSASVGLGNSFYGGARLGLMSMSGVQGYVLGAYRQTDLDWPSVATGIGPGDLKGWDLGVGLTMPVAKHVSIGLEGIWTRYDRADVSINGVDTGVNLDTDQLSVLARLNIPLGGVQALADDVAGPAPCDPKLAGCKKAKR